MFARTIEEANCYLENYIVRIINLDHHLRADELENLLPTGFDSGKLLCKREGYTRKIYFCTDNSVGWGIIYSSLKGAQRSGFLCIKIEIYHYPITKKKHLDK